MENLEKLTGLLKNSGVGFMDGNYQSFYGLYDIKKMLRKKSRYTKELMYINLSFNKEFIGEFLIHISIIKSDKILCEVCKNVSNTSNDGDYFYPIHGYGDKIIIILSPFTGTNDEIGTFRAIGPWGTPKEYEPQ